jgi:undecaprenyl diphosphate synthase
MPSSREHKLHVGIIMDGNGRWASRRGLTRSEGHRAGIDALRRVVRAAPDLNVGTLTVHAFSSDNWKRPQAETAELMAMFAHYLDAETEDLVRDGVRLSVIGRRDRLPDGLAAEIARSEAVTEWGDALHLRVAIDYSARDAILSAAHEASHLPELTRDAFASLLSQSAPDVDLLIRTSGEQRLSDFLLWECAYAEFFFTPQLWPDFDAADLAEAIEVYHRRERRFGALPAETTALANGQASASPA